MRSIGCRREYTKRGQTDRRLALPSVVDGVLSAWPRKVLAAADSDDPCKRLLAAVLCDAIRALQGVHEGSKRVGKKRGYFIASPRQLWEEASQWMLSRRQSELVNFESICEVLELDTSEVRKDLCAIASAFANRESCAVGV